MHRISHIVAALLAASLVAVAVAPANAAARLDARALRSKAGACIKQANQQKLHFAARRTFVRACLRG